MRLAYFDQKPVYFNTWNPRKAIKVSVHASVHLCSGWVRYFKVEEARGRTPRVEYAGALYHVMCRGNRRETIFEDEQDCCLFLETLAEVCARTGWEVCAYVLMPNHVLCGAPHK